MAKIGDQSRWKLRLSEFVQLMLVLFVTNLAASASGQTIGQPTAAPTADANWHFRYELFQMLLEERGLKVQSRSAVLVSPRDSVLVILGKMNREQTLAMTSGFSSFAERGGAVLLALDERTSMIEGSVGFAGRVIHSEVASIRYQGHPDCLRVTDLNTSHALTSGLSELVVNRSSWLQLYTHNSTTWEALADVPKECLPFHAPGQPLLAVGRKNTAESGTIIAAGDPSLFTNSMLWHGDNAALAIRVSEMLCRGDKRRLAFVVDGRELPSYRASPLLQEAMKPQPTRLPPHPANVPPPKPTLENLLRLSNAVIQNVEESNILNEIAVNQPRFPNRPLYAWIMVIGFVAIAAAWLFHKLEHTAAARPPSPVVRFMRTAYAIFREGADQTRAYGQAAQALARDLCHEFAAGCPVASDWWQCLSNPALEPSLQKMTPWQRRDLQMLVELAASSDAPHISSRRLQQLGKMIQTLRNLHRGVSQQVAS